MLTNSLCASLEDREISTAFCRSSCCSRSSRSFSIGLSVENTILSLIMFSGSANSHDRASVRRCVKNASKVCPVVLKESQNWYLENTIRFCPANSFSNFAFTWSNLFLSFFLRATRSGCIAPMLRGQQPTTTWQFWSDRVSSSFL